MKRNFEMSVRSLQAVAGESWNRDQVLLAADALVRAFLEDWWNLDLHIRLKSAVLKSLEEVEI